MASREIWKPVVGFEGQYSVSSAGRVRSECRRVPNGRNGASRLLMERILKPRADGGGYLYVRLGRGSEPQLPAKVADLAAAAFIGPKPRGHDVRHLDGLKTNNAAANLAYGTRSENMADARRHGTLAVGERQGNAKLTEAQVLEIRSDNRMQKDIASAYGISFQQVSAIKRRTAWSHA